MTKVYVEKRGNYPVSSPKIKQKLKRFFKDRGIVSKSDVTVAFIGEKEMEKLARKYINDGKMHNILSFPYLESEEKDFSYPPGDILRLGEIIICYPGVVKEAIAQSVTIDEKIDELIEHGALHLMGIHHN